MKFAKISRSILHHIMSKADAGSLRADVPFYCKLLTDREIDSLDNPARVYLSISNVRALLSKLDRVTKGEHSYCTLVKRDTVHPIYPCTHETAVTAVEDNVKFDDINFTFFVVSDEKYYAGRSPGAIHPKDETKCKQCGGSGLIEGLDTYGCSPSYESCGCQSLSNKKDS